MPSPLTSHASPLTQFLRDGIAARGPIPFRDFMQAALYHPQLGYYTSGRAAIGRGGDFFTNVSVGPLFGALLARQFVEMWERLGQPPRFDIVEQGAHRGEFARDVLGALQEFAPACFSACSYHIIEPWPALRRAQSKMLGKTNKICWHATLAGLPAIAGVHFSNELIDAFPVHLVSWTGDEWREQHVDLSDDQLSLVPLPLSSARLRKRLALIPQPLPPGYTTEVNLAMFEWIDQLAAKLQRGWLLAIDYGFPRPEYYRPERTAGTLAACSQHRREASVLARPGEIDLTAHVDFTSLAERAESADLRLCGFTDQHHFVVGLGQRHFEDSVPQSPAREHELRAFKTLMHPNLMGRDFKAICFEKDADSAGPLAGFHFARDPRAALAI